MRARFARLWSEHRFLLVTFALAALATFFFLLRTVVFFVYWSDADNRNRALEPWMTPRYIAYSYGLDQEQVGEILGIGPEAPMHLTLKRIARDSGVPLDLLMLDTRRRLLQAASADK